MDAAPPPGAEPRIRDAVDADFPELSRFIEAQHPGSGAAWLERVRWQRANPAQADHPLALVVDTPEGLAGYYFFIAQPLWVNGATVRSWWGLDMWLSERLRGKGMGIQMSKAALAWDGPLMSTSANFRSEPLWHKLGCRKLPDGHLALVRYFPSVRLAVARAERARLPLPALPPLGPAPPDPGARTVDADWTSEPLTFATAAALWRELRPLFRFSTDRTEEFLAWRYAPESPGGTVVGLRCRGDLRAWYAYRLAERGEGTRVRLALLLDAVAAPDDRAAMLALGRDLVARARAARSDLLEVRGLSRPFREALREAAELQERRMPANPFIGFSDVPVSAWHVALGDGDGGFA